jgi:hypothetical protein
MIARVTVQEKVTYGLENVLNYSRDDFHEDDMRPQYVFSHDTCWVSTDRNPIPQRDGESGQLRNAV